MIDKQSYRHKPQTGHISHLCDLDLYSVPTVVEVSHGDPELAVCVCAAVLGELAVLAIDVLQLSQVVVDVSLERLDTQV